MTNEKTKQFNIRIPDTLYNEIKAQADEQDITMTEYVISKLTDDSQRIDDSYKERYIEQLNARIEKQDIAIQDKEKGIQELYRLLDQQQQLTLATQRDKEQLQIELNKDSRKWWKIWK